MCTCRRTSEFFGYIRVSGSYHSNRHIHRADLHRGLLDAATGLGCKMYLDSRVVKIDPAVPSLTTKNGEVHTADPIVVSDGNSLTCSS